MKTLILIASAFFLLLSHSGYSQAQAGYYGIFSKPAFRMDDTRYRGGFGGSFELLSSDLLNKHDGNFQLRAGAGFALADQQRIKYHVILDTPDSDPGKITYSNSTIGLDGIIKLIYAKHEVKPYIDFFLGGRNYYSREKIESDRYIPGYQNLTQSTIAGGFVLDLGASLGVLFKIAPHAFFDFRTSYATSPSYVQYIDLGSVKKDGNMVNYSLVTARPQLLIFRLGFVFDIHSGGCTGRSYSGSDSNYQPNPGYNPPSYYYSPSYSKPRGGSCGGNSGVSSPKPLRLKPNVPKS